MIYMPEINDSRDMQNTVQIIELLEPELEAVIGHQEFTKLVVGNFFDALESQMQM